LRLLAAAITLNGINLAVYQIAVQGGMAGANICASMSAYLSRT
jgi:hypothetical protein